MANHNSSSEEEQAKIDAALDAALDEFSDDDDDQEDEVPPPTAALPQATRSEAAPASAAPKKQAVPMGPPRPPPASDASPEKLFADMMQGMLQGAGGSDGEGDEDDVRRMGQLMQQLTRGDEQHAGDDDLPRTTATTSSGSQKKDGSPSSRVAAAESETSQEVQDAIRNLVQDMARQASLDEQEQQHQQTAAGGNVDTTDGGGVMGGPEMDELQHLLDNLLGGIGGEEEGAIPEGENADAVIDGMMEQLLSKDLMYEPIQQVAERFPRWLQEQQHTLSPTDYAERHAQCQCFVDIVKVYENEPQNTAKLVDMMQQLQEYGPPPKEIVQQIAPGMEDFDGMAGPGGEECRVM